jgi:replicative DNA helicase
MADRDRTLDVERHCLAALCADGLRPADWSILRPEWFMLPDHRLIAAEFLRQLGETGAVDVGLAFIALRDTVTADVLALPDLGASDLRAWTRHVADLHLSREADAALRAIGATDAGLDRILAMRQRLDDLLASVTVTAAPDLLRGFLDHLDSPASSIIGTGFAGVDQRLNGGLDAGHLMIIGGQPGAGKTSFALTVAHRVATAGHAVDFWSAECSPDLLFRWLVAAASGIPAARIAQRDLTPEERETAVEAATEISGLPLRLRSTDGRDVAALAREVRATDAALVVVDYAQLIPDGVTAARGITSTAAGGGDVFSVLNAATKAAGTRMILAAALSRSSKTRAGELPNMGDIRDTSAAEHAADVLAILTSAPTVLQLCGVADAIDPNLNPMEAIDVAFALVKYRHGRAGGGVVMSFDRPRFRFLNRPLAPPRVNGRAVPLCEPAGSLSF